MTIEFTAIDRERLMRSPTLDDPELSSWNWALLRLIAKSDHEHRAALRAAFPSFVEAYEEWSATPLEAILNEGRRHGRP